MKRKQIIPRYIHLIIRNVLEDYPIPWLKPAQRAIEKHLVRYTYANDLAYEKDHLINGWPSWYTTERNIADALGYSKHTVQQHIQWLSTINFLIVHRSRRRGGFNYYFGDYFIQAHDAVLSARGANSAVRDAFSAPLVSLCRSPLPISAQGAVKDQKTTEPPVPTPMTAAQSEVVADLMHETAEKLSGRKSQAQDTIKRGSAAGRPTRARSSRRQGETDADYKTRMKRALKKHSSAAAT